MRRLQLRLTAPAMARGALVPLAALAIVATGCGGAIPTSNGGPAGIKLESSRLGHYLVDAQGHTLYIFDRDERNDSYCNGACASVWPPLETDSRPRSLAGVAGSALGRFKRDDGDMQVTYRGHPL